MFDDSKYASLLAESLATIKSLSVPDVSTGSSGGSSQREQRREQYLGSFADSGSTSPSSHLGELTSSSHLVPLRARNSMIGERQHVYRNNATSLLPRENQLHSSRDVALSPITTALTFGGLRDVDGRALRPGESIDRGSPVAPQRAPIAMPAARSPDLLFFHNDDSSVISSVSRNGESTLLDLATLGAAAMTTGWFNSNNHSDNDILPGSLLQAVGFQVPGPNLPTYGLLANTALARSERNGASDGNEPLISASAACDASVQTDAPAADVGGAASPHVNGASVAPLAANASTQAIFATAGTMDCTLDNCRGTDLGITDTYTIVPSPSASGHGRPSASDDNDSAAVAANISSAVVNDTNLYVAREPASPPVSASLSAGVTAAEVTALALERHSQAMQEITGALQRQSHMLERIRAIARRGLQRATLPASPSTTGSEGGQLLRLAPSLMRHDVSVDRHTSSGVGGTEPSASSTKDSDSAASTSRAAGDHTPPSSSVLRLLSPKGTTSDSAISASSSPSSAREHTALPIDEGVSVVASSLRPRPTAADDNTANAGTLVSDSLPPPSAAPSSGGASAQATLQRTLQLLDHLTAVATALRL